MNVKVVFHIDFDDEKRLLMALGNMTNLLKEVNAAESSICLLANGSSVNLLLESRSGAWREDVSALAEKGVRFFVCNNSLNKFELIQEKMLPVCETVKAGVLTLIELQNDGYAYIKP